MNILREHLHGINGLKHGLFNWPPAAYSTIYCRGGNPGNATPLRNGFFHPVNPKKNIDSRVIGLFKGGPPLTVSGRIALVVIDSFYRKIPARPLSHIGNKVFKRLPPFANLYASTAIVVKFLIGWVRASLSHTHPYGVFGRACTAMLSEAFCVAVGPEASTGSGPPVSERNSKDNFLVSAIAKTLPHSPATGVVFRSGNYSEPTKSLACHIFECAHNYLLKNINLINTNIAQLKNNYNGLKQAGNGPKMATSAAISRKKLPVMCMIPPDLKGWNILPQTQQKANI